MENFKYRLSLHVVHPSADPDWVTTELGLNVRGGWKAGERRRTPNGILLDGHNAESHWYHEVANQQGMELSDALFNFVEVLSTRKEFFEQLGAEGGRASISIGWFCAADCGESFEAVLLGQLGKLNISLDFFIYMPEPALKAECQ